MIREFVPPSDDALYEVVDGVYVEKPMGLVENTIANILIEALRPFCRPTGSATPSWKCCSRSRQQQRPQAGRGVRVVRPVGRRPAPTAVTAWPVAPDLAVEVVSPTDKAFDVIAKVHEYFAGGVRQVWHVYSHTEQVFVFDSPAAVRVLGRGDELTAEPVVPGFRMPMADLFPLVEAPPPAAP
jgi:Uma2 family endonuclease